MRAIIAPYDKTGATELARGLLELGWEVYATSGSQRHLQQAGLSVRGISELTGFPEILDGRVKTLHPAVHAGLLARRDRPEHLRELEEHDLRLIDLVAVNLYPFVETVARPDVRLEDALEQIDIGGPAMLRAAAKNFPHVLPLVDPADYRPVLEALCAKGGAVPLEERRRLAAKAFQHVALYDTAIASYLRGEEAGLPGAVTIALRKRWDLRYGENPHQQAAFYVDAPTPSGPVGMAAAEQLHGKQLSYVNILDADAAWNAACDFDGPAVAIVKHANPCGLAANPDVVEAWRRALAGDPISAFGGIVAVNRPVAVELARAIRESKHPTSGQRLFLEIVIAPNFEDEALALLGKSRDLRILRAPLIEPGAQRFEVRQVVGGMLMQTPDQVGDNQVELRVVTQRQPTEQELADLRFAWKAVKHVKSNAIVLAKDGAMVGVGAGQPNRVTSVFLALRAAGERADASALASDAYFPFADSVEQAAEGGVRAVIQPGGSLRDQEVIDACDRLGVAMVFTGYRHFRH
ncbi:MAG: bifunctional phosphoribosylaminoimidazolecarboxamide formyltransferase/IMP cyclohydrolase [Chloroflexi bacterium RBG_16_68_14]|nr:MAG: bifunctional phosphoribosylaminoimidazolecarboxamide formyltransferase/IMP cyclohydrolase [Chloroflexi bacterium RBG_16_68_14]